MARKTKSAGVKPRKTQVSKAASAAPRRILNCIPSKNPEKDWNMTHAVSAGLTAAAPAIPPAKDLREAWWDIGDQGATGACVGWATADGVLRWHFVKANRIPKTQHLSRRFIWMAAKETDVDVSVPTTFIEDAGTSLKAALDIARNYGAVTEDVLPFEPPTLYPGQPPAFYALASQLKIQSYFNLGRDLGAWRRWLATRGPILTRLDVDATWDNASQTQGQLQAYQPGTTRGGHAVCLVGYSPGAFIVRNSWGTTAWGDKGFAYPSDAYAAAAFTEAYGVVV
jgi:hypothetical protein